jgi:transcriptional regulator with XRE-family HTH domain
LDCTLAHAHSCVVPRAENEQPNPSPFGALVHRIRAQRGYSLAAVAARAGLAESYIQMIEKGKRGSKPSKDTVISLAQGLKATDDERAELLRLGGHPLAEDLPVTPTVEEAVNTDSRLRADQKRVLLELYRTFVR